MTAAWVFPAVAPFQVQGRDTTEDNFAQEARSNLEILVRELLQNPLDVRSKSNSGAVRVVIKLLQPGDFDTGYLQKLIDDEYGRRLTASGGDSLPDMSTATVLLLEDFGTTGLEGIWNDQNADGQTENWNAFWFREGEGAKSGTGSNGRAGQGKITFYRISSARAVFGYTVRESDKQKLLMGRSAFRRVYPFNNTKFLRHSFWCSGNEEPLPITDHSLISEFCEAFSLSRSEEPGLSLVIPLPKEFNTSEVLRTVVSEFYYPISNGRLEVIIEGKEVTSSNIDTIANTVLTDDIAKVIKSPFTTGYRKFINDISQLEKSGNTPIQLSPGWETSSSISESSFPEGALQTLRTALENGERISIRCPIKVKNKKNGVVDTTFVVHLEVPDDLDYTEEAYIRRDLLIGSELHLAANSHLQKARSLTLILDENLSAFLADAEEPTHLKWNASRPRLAEDYLNPQATLRAVRNAAPKLLAVISNGVMLRDEKALAKYFTKHSDFGKKQVSGGTKAAKSGTPGDGTPPPPPVRKPFLIISEIDGVKVLPNGTAGPKSEDLPISCKLLLAYEGLDQDPFSSYDPFDFDLNDTTTYPISAHGVNLQERVENWLTFEITDPDFSIEVAGFDKNIRLRAKFNYTENKNGTTIGDE